MILVKTKLFKTFDEVETSQDIRDKIENVLFSEHYKTFTLPFWQKGKILKRTVKFVMDDVDNWIYTSIIIWDSIKSYNECITHPIAQDIFKKLFKNGFEVEVKIKEISEMAKKMIFTS